MCKVRLSVISSSGPFTHICVNPEASQLEVMRESKLVRWEVFAERKTGQALIATLALLEFHENGTAATAYAHFRRAAVATGASIGQRGRRGAFGLGRGNAEHRWWATGITIGLARLGLWWWWPSGRKVHWWGRGIRDRAHRLSHNSPTVVALTFQAAERNGGRPGQTEARRVEFVPLWRWVNEPSSSR